MWSRCLSITVRILTELSAVVAGCIHWGTGSCAVWALAVFAGRAFLLPLLRMVMCYMCVIDVRGVVVRRSMCGLWWCNYVYGAVLCVCGVLLHVVYRYMCGPGCDSVAGVLLCVQSWWGGSPC